MGEGSREEEKGGRAGGKKNGGKVRPCDLPAVIRLKPHGTGFKSYLSQLLSDSENCSTF